MKSIKAFKGAMLAAPLVFAPAISNADTFFFDPDGLGPDPVVTVDNMDFLPGNSVAEQGVTAIDVGVGSPLTVYVQAKLAGLTLQGAKINGLGLNSTYEITIAMGFGEKVSALVNLDADPFNELATFGFDNTNSTNFVEIWQGPIDSDALTGFGFNNGTQILLGQVISSQGFFSVSNTDPIDLDQFGDGPAAPIDDYPLVDTIRGSGQTFPLEILVLDRNPDYFPTLNPGDTITMDAQNTSQVTPYLAAEPSDCFVDAPNGAVLCDTTFGNADAGFNPVLGAVNGISGPDFQFQTDFNLVAKVTFQQVEGCRITGGGVDRDGNFDSDTLAEMTKSITFGGQIGAPTADQPEPQGNWQHNHHAGKNGFAFHMPTVLTVECGDMGFCDPARPAFFKRLSATGIGTFSNVRGFPQAQFKEGEEKFVELFFRDLGEPGPGGKQPGSDICPFDLSILLNPAFNVSDQSDEDIDASCTNCADVYQIKIHETNDPTSSVIYSVSGHIDAGNLQIHPEIQ